MSSAPMSFLPPGPLELNFPAPFGVAIFPKKERQKLLRKREKEGRRKRREKKKEEKPRGLFVLFNF